MSSAGTAYIDFEGRFDGLFAQARRAGRRAGDLLAGELDGRRIGEDLGADLSAGMDPDEVGRQIGADIGDGAAAGFEPRSGLAGKIDDLGGPLAVAGMAAGVIAGSALGAGVLAGFSDAVERKSGKNLIEAQLGIDQETAARLGDSAGRVWASNFGESMGDARDAVVAVRSSIGADLGQAAIEDLSRQALTFTEVFDQDLPEAVSAAGVMMRAGLARDGEEAFDLLVASAQRMPAFVRGELLPVTAEYSTYLGALGLSGEEAFSLLVAGSQGGVIEIDKVGDALKELTIRATDMSATSVEAYEAAGLNATVMADQILAGGDTARGAFDQIVDGLLGIDDPTEQAIAALNLFGTPLEDLGVEKIPSFLASLDSGGEGLGDFEGSADRAAEALGRGLEARLESLRRQGMDRLVSFIEARVLPGLDRLMDRGEGFARVVWDRAEPAVDDLAATLGHLWSIGGQAFDAVEPIAGAVAGIGGGGVLLALQGVAAGLEATFGWLEANEGLVRLMTAGVVTLATLKAWSMLVSGVETIYIHWLYLQGAVSSSSMVMGLRAIGWGAIAMGTDVRAGASAAAGGFRMLTASASAAGLAVGAVTLGAITAWQEWSKQAENARQEMEGLKPAGFDSRSLSDMETYSSALNAFWAEASNAADGAEGFSAANAAVLDGLPVLETGMMRTIQTTREAEKAYGDQSDATRALRTAYQETWELVNDYPIDPGYWLGVDDPAWGEMEQLITDLDLDPATQSFEEMADEITGYLRTTAEEAGYRGPQISEAMALSPDELERQKAAWEEMSGAVAGSWSSALDSITGLGSLEKVTGASVTEWYATQTQQATDFASDIQEAFALGYDPQMISGLLQAGPAEAAPIVQGLVDNHSANLLWTVNAGENALRELNQQAIEMARLTHLATTSTSSQMTADLGTAMQISEVIGRSGANATWSAIADELGIGVDRVRDIADGYGIELAAGINPVLDAVGADPIVMKAMGDRWAGQAQSVQHRNAGGEIFGPRVDADVVPAMLTPGEYVVRRGVVDTLGVGFFDQLNKSGDLPAAVMAAGYNRGGQVTGDVAGMHPVLLSRLQAWSASVGQRYHVTSGYRSIAEQQRLYQAYLAGRGNLAAAPGSSMHNFGLASDGPHWGGRNPSAFGLRYSVPGEPWHVEPVEARALRGSGVSSHGTFFDPLPAVPDFGAGAVADAASAVWSHARDQAMEWMGRVSYQSDVPDLGPVAAGSVRAMVQQMAAARGWTGAQWSALDELVRRESSWRPGAQNPTSSAYGLFQFLDSTWRPYGAKTSDPMLQASYGLRYIADRYGSPSAALAFHDRNNWYNAGGPVPDTDVFVHRRTFDTGGTLREGWNLVENRTGDDEPLTPPGAGAGLRVEGDLVVRDATDIDLIVQKLDARTRRRRVR